jgi:hypothetical protein
LPILIWNKSNSNQYIFSDIFSNGICHLSCTGGLGSHGAT